MIKRSIKQSIKVPLKRPINNAIPYYDGKYGLVINGIIPPYVGHSRSGIGNNGDGSTSIENVPTYEFIDIYKNKAFRQLEPDPVTSNASTQSLAVTGAEAIKPWSFITDDNVIMRKGLLEFFSGDADGVDVKTESYFVGSNITNVNNNFEVTASGTGNDNRVIFDTDTLPVGQCVEYKVNFSTGGEIQTWDGSGYSSVGLQLSGVQEFRGFTSGSTDAPIKMIDLGTNGELLSIIPVSPANGSCDIVNHTIHDLSVDTVLGQFEEGDFVCYNVKAVTGIIELLDGTNTAVSRVGVVAGTPFSVSLRHSGTTGKMWVTLNDTKGIEVDFAGFPEVGANFFGIVTATYQANVDYIFSPILPYSLIEKDGKLVVKDDKYVVRYL